MRPNRGGLTVRGERACIETHDLSSSMAGTDSLVLLCNVRVRESAWHFIQIKGMVFGTISRKCTMI